MTAQEEADEEVAKTKRYAKFPRQAEFIRSVPSESLEWVIGWHNMLVTTHGRFTSAYNTEAYRLGLTSWQRTAALGALKKFRETLHEITNLLYDQRPSDWCCARGALAYPAPCPQHGGAELGEVRWVAGGRQVWLADGWHHLGARVEAP